MVSNNKSPTSREELGSEDATLYRAAKSFTLDRFVATEFTLEISVATVDMFDITPNGAGVVRIDGNVDISTGAIDLKNGGTQSYIRFYCESSNAHYAQLQAPAHSAFGGNITLTMPATTGTLALTSQLPTSGISSSNS